MSMTAFYYGAPGAKAQGPLEWDAIRAAYHAGRLGKDSVVAQTALGPWVTVEAVERAGLAAFVRAGGASHEAEGAAPAQKPQEAAARKDSRFEAPFLAVFLQVMGTLGFIVTGGCVIAAVVLASWPPLLAALSCLVSSALCLAIGRILSVAEEIKWGQQRLNS